MTKVAVLTKEQHRLLYGQQYNIDCMFSPALDQWGNIIISEQEIAKLNNEEFAWVKDLILVEPEELDESNLT